MMVGNVSLKDLPQHNPSGSLMGNFGTKRDKLGRFGQAWASCGTKRVK